ncbi:MAG TPA: peroxiredoxin [Hyphomicrobium sp.]|nr:peroxiredoxin [Hyphomicrobium sp.]
MAIEAGMTAPDFALPDSDEKIVSLRELRGKPVVVYFYPKDDTAGCTTEAKDFTCLSEEFGATGAILLGISPDSPASHRKFTDKHGLGVRLLSDGEHTAAEAYGVWVEKSMYGRKFMGVERATFLINTAGKVARVWRKVSVPGHAEEVLAAVRALKG